MSLMNHFFREFRPLIRMLEEPLMRTPASFQNRYSHPLSDPLFSHDWTRVPAVDLSEHGNNYILEADLPGVKKEDVKVQVGDNGQSISIHGKISKVRAPGTAGEEQSQPHDAPVEQDTGSSANLVEAAQLSVERPSFSSNFSRTVWLPRPVDGQQVSAKLTDGVLTITVPKAEDRASVTIPIQ